MLQAKVSVGGQDMVGEQIINTGTEKQQKVCCSLKPYGSARRWDPSWIATTDVYTISAARKF